jgi:hypothetical protein
VEHGSSDSTAALRAELVLLQEENARLKAARHQQPDLGTFLERARALPAAGADREEAGDEAAEMLLESLVLRDSLLKVCEELTGSMLAVESRLREVGGGMRITATDRPADAAGDQEALGARRGS